MTGHNFKGVIVGKRYVIEVNKGPKQGSVHLDKELIILLKRENWESVSGVAGWEVEMDQALGLCKRVLRK